MIPRSPAIGDIRGLYRKYGWKMVTGTLSIVLFLIYRYYTPTRIVLLTEVDFHEYEPFEPVIVEDFDIEEPKVFKIEKIIHQTWKDRLIPPQFADNIKTFVAHNPDWQYYLWTDESARYLIRDHYPQLLSLWDSAMFSRDKIRKADALRYIVLYHYGGVYADMDVIDYRPLNAAITKHPCVFIPEPYEQAVFRGHVPYLISNAIMMCAAKHPFLKQLVENLYTFEHMQAVWDATGPGYVTTQYKLYNQLPKEKEYFVLYNRTYKTHTEDSSPYFYKGNYSWGDSRSVYIANSQYFIFSLDQDGFRAFYWRCLWFNYLTHMQKRACVNMVRKGLSRDPNIFSITDHRWYRTYGWYNFYNYLSAYNNLVSTDIKHIVPHVQIYKCDKASITNISHISQSTTHEQFQQD